MSIARCKFAKIEPLRALHLQELNAQCRNDAAHYRTGALHYLVRRDGRDIGYGAVKDAHEGRGTLFEFYLVPAFRTEAIPLLHSTLDESGAGALECQTNDLFYTSLVRQFPGKPSCDTILFAAGQANGLHVPGAVVRRRHRRDRIFEHKMEPVGDFVAEVNGDIVGTAGFLLHYNPPFADIYMEVREDARRRGYGALLIQETIKECYLAGRVPAARTSTDNIASQRTLARGGLRECGRMLRVEMK